MRARAARTFVNGQVVAAVDVHNASTYVNHKCRCPDCKTAWAQSMQEQRANRKLRTAANGGVAPTKTHGAATYSNWGCRCETCRAAWSSSQRVTSPPVVTIYR